jgi:hypothetical protein
MSNPIYDTFFYDNIWRFFGLDHNSTFSSVSVKWLFAVHASCDVWSSNRIWWTKLEYIARDYQGWIVYFSWFDFELALVIFCSNNWWTWTKYMHKLTNPWQRWLSTSHGYIKNLKVSFWTYKIQPTVLLVILQRLNISSKTSTPNTHFPHRWSVL